MATTYTCDRCSEVIDRRVDSMDLYFSGFRKYNLPKDPCFCRECSDTLAMCIKKFIKAPMIRL
ncbi:MAG: hypothetical protein NT091_00465 [Candidatus Falkowbacteria bacterium]|nr:hypothetical protein [Candidatus Falkowbacteria bacterium]